MTPLRNAISRTCSCVTTLARRRKSVWSVFRCLLDTSPSRLSGSTPKISAPPAFLAHEKKASWSRFNQTVCALRFLYCHTLHKDWTIQHIPFPRKESKLPEVLSPEEVSRLLAAMPKLKYQVLLTTIYATGLRASEVLHLQVSDIDSRCQTIRVPPGQGQ